MFKVNNEDANGQFLLLTLNLFHIFSSVSIANFEHMIAGWVGFFRILFEDQSVGSNSVVRFEITTGNEIS